MVLKPDGGRREQEVEVWYYTHDVADAVARAKKESSRFLRACKRGQIFLVE